jgi:hypothetical protein
MRENVENPWRNEDPIMAYTRARIRIRDLPEPIEQTNHTLVGQNDEVAPMPTALRDRHATGLDHRLLLSGDYRLGLPRY